MPEEVGLILISMHDPEVNQLTQASLDPHSRHRNYKACAMVVTDIRLGEKRYMSWMSRSTVC